MPCGNMSGIFDEAISRRIAKENRVELSLHVNEMENRLNNELNRVDIKCDKLTRLLCYILNNLDDNNKDVIFKGEYGEEVKAWLEEHSEFDRKRLKLKLGKLGLDKTEVNILRQMLNEGHSENEGDR